MGGEQAGALSGGCVCVRVCVWTDRLDAGHLRWRERQRGEGVWMCAGEAGRCPHLYSGQLKVSHVDADAG